MLCRILFHNDSSSRSDRASLSRVVDWVLRRRVRLASASPNNAKFSSVVNDGGTASEWGDETTRLVELAGRFRDASIWCARSNHNASERAVSPPCEGGARGGGQGITNMLGQAGKSARPITSGPAYQAMVPPEPPPLVPPSQGGKKSEPKSG